MELGHIHRKYKLFTWGASQSLSVGVEYNSGSVTMSSEIEIGFNQESSWENTCTSSDYETSDTNSETDEESGKHQQQQLNVMQKLKYHQVIQYNIH